MAHAQNWNKKLAPHILYLEYMGLCKAIPEKWKKTLGMQDAENNSVEDYKLINRIYDC